MNTHRKIWSAVLAVGLLLGAGCLSPSTWAANEAHFERFVGAQPTVFETPEDAVTAFKAAVAATDYEGLALLLGLDAAELKKADGIDQRIAEIRDGAAKLLNVEGDGGQKTLKLGYEVWPFPFPLRKNDDGKWAFDTYAGLEEIVNRRVGENELQAIATMRAYVEAQREYASADHDGDGVLEYAQKLVSSNGATDGLYWPIEQGDGESPAGPFVDQAALDKAQAGDGYFGYRFRILRAQGNQVAGGRYHYVINGNMIAGFGLVAWPARYAETGVKTFVVNQAGIVYEADLGRNTERLARKIRRFNPNKSWNVVSD
ncbi:MAG: DUF2950 family protein [Anderseniella sp.]|nr:DUF2950 family protein [Anderseniella sp.]